jgi:dethiobiotin synthetase
VTTQVKALLIAGTDTEVGKTVLTTALAAYWQTYCSERRLGLMKPVQSGLGDRELYHQLLDLQQSPEEITPLAFSAPLAPPLAAEREGRPIELEKAWAVFDQLYQTRDFVLVESLGGLGSPVTWETTVADLAWDWRLPVVLVVPVRLGAISQAVANVALARLSRVHLRGIVLNCTEARSQTEIDQWAPADLIQRLTQVPVLGCMPHLADATDLAKLAQVASNLSVERLLPI